MKSIETDYKAMAERALDRALRQMADELGVPCDMRGFIHDADALDEACSWLIVCADRLENPDWAREYYESAGQLQKYLRNMGENVPVELKRKETPK